MVIARLPCVRCTERCSSTVNSPTVENYETKAREVEESRLPVFLKIGQRIVWVVYALVVVSIGLKERIARRERTTREARQLADNARFQVETQQYEAQQEAARVRDARQFALQQQEAQRRAAEP